MIKQNQKIMYSLYDLYTDIMAGRRSEFTYSGNTFFVGFSHNTFEAVITHRENQVRCRAFLPKKQLDCGTALQGIAILLLEEKKKNGGKETDIYFDRHGDLCSKEQYSPIVTKEQREEDDLEKLINNVLDIDTDDNFHP